MGHMPKSIQEKHEKKENIRRAKICKHYVNGLKCFSELKTNHCVYVHDDYVKEAFRKALKGYLQPEEVEEILS